MKKPARSQSDQTILLPHWLTPAFAAACLDTGKCKGEDQIARYEAIARGRDWETANPGKLAWKPPYAGHLAYDQLKASMAVGLRVTRTAKGWQHHGTVIAILPGYNVEVEWDNRARQTCHVVDLKEIKYDRTL